MPGEKSETIHHASEFGTAAMHSGKDLQPLRVAPATAQEINTISFGLPVAACMSLHDLVFDTDSSFVMPDAAKVLHNLPALREGHKTQKGELPLISIFAHADPSGSDEYNKVLSGRRARSVYSLLLHNVSAWEQLYSHPYGGDDWKKKDVMDIIRQHLGAGAPVARSDLFLAYMKSLCPAAVKKSDFLGRGADSGGKADYQGCAEFNPLLLLSKQENQNLPKPQWRRLNQANRRVVLFLFSPTIKVNPSFWPCPRWSEPGAACKHRFFPDANQRRAPGKERREFSKTKDTFSCRFYQFFAEASPCERLLHYVRIRLFDHFGKPVYGAPYKLDFPGASATGVANDSYAVLADVEVPAAGKVYWSRPYSKDDVTTLPPGSDKYEYELQLYIDDREEDREECARRRLNNFGYCADDTLEKNIRDFQQDIGRAAPDGSLDDIFEELEERHAACNPPQRHPV